MFFSACKTIGQILKLMLFVCKFLFQFLKFLVLFPNGLKNTKYLTRKKSKKQIAYL